MILAESLHRNGFSASPGETMGDPGAGATARGLADCEESTMAERTCDVDGCDRRVFSRAWCQKHYTRWLRHGDPTITHDTRDIPPLERIAPLIDAAVPGGCWLWTGTVNAEGYASRHLGPGSSLVHRWLYEQLLGPIEDNLPLDHLCHTRDVSCTANRDCPHRRCVNPDHLEPVTHAENSRRGRSPANLVVQTNRCKRGHDYAVHGYVRRDGRGRQCLACQRITAQRRRERLRGAA